MATGRSLGCQRPGVRAVVGARCPVLPAPGPCSAGPPHPPRSIKFLMWGVLGTDWEPVHAARGLGPGWVEPNCGLGLMGSKASWPLQVAGRRPSRPAFPGASARPWCRDRTSPGRLAGPRRGAVPPGWAACRAPLLTAAGSAHVLVFVDDVVFCSLKMYIFSYCT